MIVQIPSDAEIKFEDDVTNADTDTVVININRSGGDEMQKEKSQSSEIEMGPKENKYSQENRVKLNEFLTSYKYFQGQKNIWVQYMTGQNADPAFTSGEPLQYDNSRNGFILTVFTLVFIMLMLTATFNFMVLVVPSINHFFRVGGLLVVMPAIICMIALNYAMACSPCTRRPPMNFICLLIAVVCMSVITAHFTRKYQTTTIMLAVIATSIVVFICMMLACTSFDFTKFMLYIVVGAAAISAVFLVISLGMLVTKTYIKPLHIAMLLLGTLVQSVLLVMELQMILGGRTVELGEEDYAFGAYLLYTSIIDLFIKILQLTGMMDNE
ncbi:hypothetical protein ACJJTC_004183 [Scirpophaga incertulas]